MTERFTETLKRESEPLWTKAVEHRFVGELFAGSVADEVVASYLVQDYRFLDSFQSLLGPQSPPATALRPGCVWAGSSAWCREWKSTYFLRAFTAIMREAAAAGPGEADVSRNFFRRAVELAFFDAAYERGEREWMSLNG